MKRIFTLCLAAVLALSLAACGKDVPPASSQSSGSGSSSAGTSDVSEPSGSGAVSTPDSSVPGGGDWVDFPVDDHNTPGIVAAYAPEHVPEEMIVFREEPTDYDQAILFHVQTDLAGAYFVEVEYTDDADYPEQEGKILFQMDDLKKGDEFVIVTSFPGDLPNRGISFDQGGQHEGYVLSVSGEDGSLNMLPIGGVIPGWTDEKNPD